MIANTVHNTTSKYLLQNADKLFPEFSGYTLSFQRTSDQPSAHSWSNILEYRLLVNEQVSNHIVVAKLRHGNSHNALCPMTMQNLGSSAEHEYNALRRINLFCTQVKSSILYGVKPLGYLKKPDVLFLEKVEGLRLFNYFGFSAAFFRRNSQELREIIHRCGIAYRVLHSMPTDNDNLSSNHFYNESIKDIRRCWSCPHLDRSDSVLADKMTNFLNSMECSLTSIIPDVHEIAYLHGDCQSKNIMVLPTGSIAFIDMVLSRMGLVYEDIARFVVHLKIIHWFNVRRIGYPRALREQLIECFLRGYFGARPPSRRLLGVFMIKFLLIQWCHLARVLQARQPLLEKSFRSFLDRYFKEQLLKILEDRSDALS